MKKKKGRKALIITVLAVVLVGAGGFFLLSMGGGGAAAMVQQTAWTGTISTYSSFAGNVVVLDSQTVTASEGATVREVYVAEGDTVQKDDRLLRLSTGTVIKAGMDGEITNLNVKEDEEVSAGHTLVEIVDFDHLAIEFKVDEFDMADVALGKQVQVTIQATGQFFTAEISYINKQATVSGDVAYYIARVDVDAQSALLPGMQADVRLPGVYAQDVTILSMSALSFDEENRPYVMLVDSSGAAHKQTVQLGVNDGVNVEIVSGVLSGDVVELQATAVVPSSDFQMGGMGGGSMGGRMGGGM